MTNQKKVRSSRTNASKAIHHRVGTPLRTAGTNVFPPAATEQGFVPRINNRVESIPPSAIRKFFDLAASMPDDIPLTVGESDFGTPLYVRHEAIRTLELGYTKYTPNAGLRELREAVSHYVEKWDLSYDYGKEILITVGASEALDLAIRTICNPDDEVIIHQPNFICYPPLVSLAGATPVIVETKESNSFKLTAEDLKAAITPRTKALILSYPNNPTGATMTRDDLEALATVLRETDIAILSDEIYAELSYGEKHTSIASLPGMRERTIYIGGLAKAHAMTGWRMGFACAPAYFIEQMAKIHQYTIMSAPTTSQYAAIAALEKGDEDVARMRESYDERRRFFVDGLRRLGLPCFEPEGAFYAFPNITVTGRENFAEDLLRAERVAVVPGDAFGACGRGFVRCCYAASSDDLKTALERIKRFISSNAAIA